MRRVLNEIEQPALLRQEGGHSMHLNPVLLANTEAVTEGGYGKRS